MSILLEDMIRISELSGMEKESKVKKSFNTLYLTVRSLEPKINHFYQSNKDSKEYEYQDLRDFILLVRDIYNKKRVGECANEYDVNSINERILDNFPELKFAFKNYLKSVNE